MKAQSSILCVAFLIICGCSYSNLSSADSENGTDGSTTFDDSDNDCQETSGSMTYVSLAQDASTCSGSGVAISGNVITIGAEGVYSVSGALSDGQLAVNDEADEGVVKIVLNGASIACATGFPVYVKKASKVVLTLAAGTFNSVSDAASYSPGDEPNAAVFAADDLTINGSGGLDIHGNSALGIVCKDDLKITGGTLSVSAVSDGIRGRNSLAISAGAITVASGGDGLSANNDKDASSGNLFIGGGTFNIVSGGGSSRAVGTDSSAKGIKAVTKLTIDAGAFTVDSADDCLHSDGDISISGGTFALSGYSGSSGGADALDAAAGIAIAAGEINVLKCYEGFEGLDIAISGGDISITAADDGLNASAGLTAGGAEQDDGSSVTISGGYIAVYSGTDGLDSNGTAAMTGGTLVIHGPTGSPEVPIDVNGDFIVSGGLLIAVGASGSMLEGPSASSTQCSFIVTFSSSSKNLIHIQDSAGTDILTFQPAKNYGALVFSTPSIAKNTAYSIYTGGNVSGGATSDGYTTGGAYTTGNFFATLTPTSAVTTYGGTTNGGPSGPGGR